MWPGGDQPVFPGMHQASALVAGATLAAARAVWSGTARHGASIAGGMHHAMAARASGFGDTRVTAQMSVLPAAGCARPAPAGLVGPGQLLLQPGRAHALATGAVRGYTVPPAAVEIVRA